MVQWRIQASPDLRNSRRCMGRTVGPSRTSKLAFHVTYTASKFASGRALEAGYLIL